MPRTYNGTKLGAPSPAHTLTEAAESARQAVRSHAVKKQVDAIITKIGDAPSVQPGAVPRNAAALLKTALAVGYDARLVHGHSTMNLGKSNEELVPAVMVAGKHRNGKRGFRATWVRGRAAIGIWYEAGVTLPSGKSVGVTAVMERVMGRER